MRIYKKKSLPLLNIVMRMKHATNEALATAAGVSVKTVCTARRGQAIQAGLADIICQALCERDFQRDSRGRKAV